MVFDNLKFKFTDYTHQVVAENELLYKLWIKYYVSYIKGFRKKLPNHGDHFYFDGYPRSGNTYTKGLISEAFPELVGTSHLHSRMGINLAIRNQIPIFIIIRKPLDAVASDMFRKVENNFRLSSEKLADLLLKKYIRYYSHVKNHLENITIIKFEALIQNQKVFLKIFSRILDHDIDTDAKYDFDKIVKKFDAEMNEREKSKRNAISSLPNETRKNFKKNNQNTILSSSFYKQANVLYEELIQVDILSPAADNHLKNE